MICNDHLSAGPFKAEHGFHLSLIHISWLQKRDYQIPLDFLKAYGIDINPERRGITEEMFVNAWSFARPVAGVLIHPCQRVKKRTFSHVWVSDVYKRQEKRKIILPAVGSRSMVR